MNRFVISDGLPYLLAKGKVYSVRFDADGFTVGEVVDKAISPYPLYTAREILAKCAVPDSIGGRDSNSLDDMTLAELKEYAKTHNIDLGSARTKAKIIEAINASGEQVVSE